MEVNDKKQNYSTKNMNEFNNKQELFFKLKVYNRLDINNFLQLPPNDKLGINNTALTSHRQV